MSDELQCHRCGASLARLTLPLSRQDQCPSCSHYLHVCRLCLHFDPNVARQCREDDAEEVMNKDKPNFCDWFEPAPGRFDAGGADSATRAQRDAEALFGDGGGEEQGDDPLSRAAEDLFR